MDLPTRQMNRTENILWNKQKSHIHGLSATFGTRVHKVPEVIKNVFKAVQEILNGNIRTRQNVQIRDE